MPAKPIIYLAFANNLDRPLLSLREEWRALTDLLQPLDDRGYIQLIHNQSTEIDDIIKDFSQYKDQIYLFHYAGHANEDHILLEDGKAESEKLAQLIAEQKNLRLAILNGCSTLGQVDKLLELGVPAIIATAAPVNDNSATTFAKIYFEAFKNNRTVKDAFDFACNGLTIGSTHNRIVQYYKDASGIYKYRDTSGQYRGLVRNGEEEPEVFPWGLYYDLEKAKRSFPANTTEEDILQKHPVWQLPSTLPEEELDELDDIDGDNKPNFLRGVLEAMGRYNEGIRNKSKDPFGDALDERLQPQVIIEHLPWPISAQLRKLLALRGAAGSHGFERILQLIQAFQAVMSFISYVLFSQLWDESRKKNPHINLLGKKMDLLHEHANNHSFFQLLQTLYSVFKESGVQPFIEELPDGFPENPTHASWKAYHFFNDLFHKLKLENFQGLEAKATSKRAEHYLSIVLKQLAFLANYRLFAIKNIRVQKIKHLGNSKYHHVFSFLHGTQPFSIVYRREPRTLYGPIYSNAVLLMKERDIQFLRSEAADSITEVEEGVNQKILNLSPFFIDKNAFVIDKNTRHNNPYIFIFDYAAEDIYYYKSVDYNVQLDRKNDADWMNTGSEEFEILKQQFQSMKQDLNL